MILSDAFNKNELARLSDLRLSKKMIGHHFRMSKPSQVNVENNIQNIIIEKQDLKISTEKSSEVSSDPLPVFW